MRRLTGIVRPPKGHDLEHVWHTMMWACESGYQTNYSLRGVRVHPRYFDFNAWYEEYGDRPRESNGHPYVFARIDKSKGFVPGNCRWMTRAESLRVVEASQLVTIGGATKSLAQWMHLFEINRSTVHTRIKRGWDVVRALTEPPRRPCAPRIRADGTSAAYGAVPLAT